MRFVHAIRTARESSGTSSDTLNPISLSQIMRVSQQWTGKLMMPRVGPSKEKTERKSDGIIME